jgi:LEA14-like dessication related protein
MCNRYIMRLFYLFSSIVLSAMLLSCSGFESIDVGEIEDIKLNRFADRAVEFEVMMPIENPSAFRFRIVDVDLDVYINSEYLGKISNVDNVLIPSRSYELYTFPLKVEFSNIMRGAVSMFNFFLDKQAFIEVSGNIRVRSFPFSRNLSVDEKTHLKLN